jgi:THO complex subunit 1
MDFQARYILVKPPTPETLASRLGKQSSEDVPDEAKIAEVYNHTITNDDLDAASTALSAVIFEKGLVNGDADAEMNDAEGESGEKVEGVEDEDTIVVANP